MVGTQVPHKISPLTTVLLLAILSFPVASAQQSGPGAASWTRFGPEGGETAALAVDRFLPSRIYAATASEGVYRSFDGGTSWSPSNLGLDSLDTTGLAVDPTQDGTLFVTTWDGLYRSTDAATSWTKVGSLPETYLNLPIISAAAPSEVFVGGPGPFRSLDNGQTWTRIDNGIIRDHAPVISALAASSTAPLRLFAGTDVGLFGSDDHGDSWNRIDLGSHNGQEVALIAVDPRNGERVFVSVGDRLLLSLDGGSTFSTANGIENGISAMVFDSTNPEVAYCASYDGGVLRSLDGGNHWGLFNSGLPVRFNLTPVFVNSLALVEQPTRHLLAGTGLGTVSKSLPNGQWIASHRGMRALQIREVMKAPRASSTWYVASNGPLYRSLDSGRTWKAVLNQGIFRLGFDTQSLGRVYAGSFGVYRSLDGGDNWSWRRSGLTVGFFGNPLDVRGLAVDPQSPLNLVVGGPYAVFSTDNGGNLFRRLGAIPGYVSDLAIDPESSQTIYSTTDSGFFKSEDGGANWRRIEQGLPPTSGGFLTVEIDPLNPSLLYTGTTSGGAFRSRDKGETWTGISRGLTGSEVGAILIDPSLTSTVYAGTEAGVERSVDGGDTWSLLTTSGLLGQPVSSLALESSDPITPPSPIAGTQRAGLFKLQLPNIGTFAQFGDGHSDRNAFSSELILLNLDDDNPSNATVYFRDDQGAALTVAIDGVQSNGRLDISLPSHSTRLLKTDGSGPLRSGWAALHADLPVEGVIVFESDAGAAGVGRSKISRSLTIPIRTSSRRHIDTGLALANPLASPCQIELRLFDSDHQILAQAEVALPALGQSAFFVDQIAWSGEVDFGDFLGLLSADAQSPVAATAIQTQPGEFATYPVIEVTDLGKAGSGNPSTLHFPHFANGSAGRERIVSTLLLVNRSLQQPARAVIGFRDQEGMNSTATLFPGFDEAIELEIPPGGLRALETNGLGDVVSGSATVVSDQPLDGVLIYSGESGAAGVGPSPSFSHGWAAPVQTEIQKRLDTGVAVMNLDDTPSSIHMTLRNGDGLALAETSLDLPGRGQRVFFIDQLEWTPTGGPIDFSHFLGWVEATSPNPSAATIIRARPAQFAVFPVAGRD